MAKARMMAKCRIWLELDPLAGIWMRGAGKVREILCSMGEEPVPKAAPTALLRRPTAARHESQPSVNARN